MEHAEGSGGRRPRSAAGCVRLRGGVWDALQPPLHRVVLSWPALRVVCVWAGSSPGGGSDVFFFHFRSFGGSEEVREEGSV